MAATDQIADGVHRLGTEWVGWYLIAGDAEVIVVDCGFPGYHAQLGEALSQLGRPLDSVGAVVLTHYHSDHVGSAERIRAASGATVYAPSGDAEGLRTGKVPLPGGLAANLWRPRMMRYMAHAVRNGGAKMEKVAEFDTYEDGDALPGGLRAVHTPGHTAGHCSLLAEHAGVLFAGDALATVDLRNGETGPRVPPFNEDPAQAAESIARLEPLQAQLVACGHGIPFTGSPAEAVEAARRVR